MVISTLLLAGIISITGLWLTQTTAGLRMVLNLINQATGGAVSAQEVSGKLSAWQATGLRIEQDGVTVTLESVEVDWTPSGWLADRIDADRIEVSKATIVISPSPSSASQPDLALPYDVLVRNAQIDSMLVINGDTRLTGSLRAELALTARRWSAQVQQLDSAEFSASGEAWLVPGKTLEHEFNLVVEAGQSGPLQLSGRGDARISRWTVDSSRWQTSVQGELRDWLEQFHWQASAEINEPADLAGELRLTASGNAEVIELEMNGELEGQPVSDVNVSLALIGETLSVDGQGSVANLPIDVSLRATADMIESGRLTIMPTGLSMHPSAPIDRLVVDLTGPWTGLQFRVDGAGRLPGTTWKGDLLGQWSQDNRFDIEAFDLAVYAGRLTGKGHLLVDAGWSGELDITAADLELRALDERLPTDLAGVLNVQGWFPDGEPPGFSLTLKHLQATIEGVGLSGRGSMNWSVDRFTELTALVETDRNDSISASLVDVDTQRIQLNPSIANLGSLVSGARGEILGELQVSLLEREIDGWLTAMGLLVPDLLQADAIQMTAELTETDHSTVRFQVDQMALGGIDVGNLTIALNGAPEQHRFEIRASRDVIDVNLAGRGSWQSDRYEFLVDDLGLTEPKLGELRNKEPLSGQIQAGSMILNTGCLASDFGRVCAQIDHDGRFRLSFDVDVPQPPEDLIAFLRELGFPPMRAIGRISGTGQIERIQDQFEGVDLDLNVEGFEFSIGNDEYVAVRDLHLRAQGFPIAQFSAGADLASGRLNLMGEVELGDDEPVFTGRLTGRLDDLAELSALSLNADVSHGVMNIDLSLTDKQQFAGHVQIDDLVYQLPDLGVTQTASLRLDWGNNGEGKGVVLGSVRAGDGVGRLDGSVLWADRRLGATLRLQGRQMLIANTPDLSLSASPKLDLVLDNGQVKAMGEIVIEDAFSTLQTPGTGVFISPDVVIVDAPTRMADANGAVTGEVDLLVSFAKPGRILGHGLSGDVSGQIRVSQHASGVVLGNGELSITGSYQAFGQKLEIRDGRMIYVNTSIDSPTIEARAVRVVGDVEAGVRVSGRVPDLRAELYSVPAMQQADVLHYLVLGKPPGTATNRESNQLAQAALSMALHRGESGFKNFASSVGLSELNLTQELGGLALSLGRQLSPKLYVGYTVGLLEPSSLARLRYVFGKAWALETEISDETRAALKYRIERN